MTRRYGSKQPSKQSQAIQAQALLLNCTDDALARLTIDTLVASYGVRVDWADNALAAERAARVGRVG